MARKKGNKGKKGKPNRKKLLTKLSRGGFSRKEVKRVSRKLKITPKRAAKVTQRFTKKQNKAANNRFKLNINANTNFKRASSTQGPLRSNYNPTPPKPRPAPPTVPEQIKEQAPNLTGPNTPTPTQTSFNDNEALLSQLMGQYDNTAYLNQISALQSTIKGLESDVGGYQTELNTLGDKYRDMELDQAQFETGDSQYLSGNNARGVRLRRSRNRNLFALGTGQFNRKNRNKNLAIGNVNL